MPSFPIIVPQRAAKSSTAGSVSLSDWLGGNITIFYTFPYKLQIRQARLVFFLSFEFCLVIYSAYQSTTTQRYLAQHRHNVLERLKSALKEFQNLLR